MVDRDCSDHRAGLTDLASSPVGVCKVNPELRLEAKVSGNSTSVRGTIVVSEPSERASEPISSRLEPGGRTSSVVSLDSSSTSRDCIRPQHEDRALEGRH